MSDMLDDLHELILQGLESIVRRGPFWLSLFLPCSFFSLDIYLFYSLTEITKKEKGDVLKR
jgi:hypothetical protein